MQDLGCPRTWGSHTLNVQPTPARAPALANPGETRAVPSGRCKFPQLEPPVSEGPAPVLWPVRGLRPLVPALHVPCPAQATEPEEGEGGGRHGAVEGMRWQIFSLLPAFVWVRVSA